MKHILLLALLAGSAHAAEPDLRLELVRESLTGTHYRYREYVGGVGTENYTTVSEPKGAHVQSLVQTAEPPAMVRVEGRVARRLVVEEQPGQPWLHLYDVETGALIRRVPHFYNAKPARVFDPNPVVATSNPDLRDQNDAASAVPASAYKSVTIDSLAGPHVLLVDRQAPNVAPVTDSAPSFEFDRSQSGFEDVNAFFHIDRNQRYLQSLGYTGSRQIVPYAIEVDTHAQGGADNSTFVPSATSAGRGVLFYGTGGTDDAEDADIVIHEYAHAIHEWISPGTFLGTYASQARALSEGFGDYWAFSQHVERRSNSARSPFCFGDWDARCGPGSENCAYPENSDCLRRLDSDRTIAEYETSDTGGVEHRNGLIWARALIDLYRANVEKYGRAEGKRITDTLVLEALFGVPPNPTFVVMAQRMTAVDRALNGGRNVQAIQTAMMQRGLNINAEPYNPQSDVLHVQSVERGLPIPDANPDGVVATVRVGDKRTIRQIGVRVDIDHSARGDLRLLLTAPNGATFLLQDVSFDRSPGIHATYGFDATPVQSLQPIIGLRAEGVWTLRASDHRVLDVGTLRSWTLVLQLEGVAVDPPVQSERPLIIPTVRKEASDFGKELQTQLRLVNPGKRRLASVTYVPTGPEGSAKAATVLVEVGDGQSVVFDDVLAELFRTAGSGALYIRGVSATSRTWARHGDGTVGMRVGAVDERTYVVRLPTTLLMQNAPGRAARLGVLDASGQPNSVRITIWDGSNMSQMHQQTIALQPNEHRELLVPVTLDSLVIEVRGERAGIAYGIETNAKTGDLLYVRPTDLESVPAISAQGANGTYWRTELTVTRNDANFDRFWIPITFYNAVTGETMSTVVQDPELHQTLRFPDVIATLFERPGHFGRLDIGLTPGVVGSARMTSDGTHTALPGFAPGARSLHMLAVENNRQFRTNIGVYADLAGPVTIHIYDASGQVVESHTVQAPQRRLITFRVTAPVTNGYAVATIERGAIRVYASVVDNATGDALMD